MLDQVEAGAAAGQDDGAGLVPRDKDLLVAFGQAAHGDVVYAQAGKLLDSSRELRLAAVDHQEVGL